MPRVRLEDTKDWQLAERSHDVRGRELRDSVGRALGTIQTMIVDTEARRVESVVLEDGNEYPVRDLQIMEQAVYFIPAAGAPTAAGYTEPAATDTAVLDDAAPAEADLVDQGGLQQEAAGYAGASPAIPPPAAPAFSPNPGDFAGESAPADDVATPAPGIPEEAPAHPSERFTWHPATPPSPPPAAPEPGSTWESTPAAGDWAVPAADTTPAPPAMDPVAESPTAESSPYAPPSSYAAPAYEPPPAYAAPAYNPPPPPPPYVAPGPAEEPALEAQREGYTEAVAPETPVAAAPDAPAEPTPVEPMDTAFAAPAMPYAEPTDTGFASESASYEAGEPAFEDARSDVAPGPPELPSEPESPSAYTASGLAAGGLAAGGFAGPPADTADTAQAYAAPTDVRPVEPLMAGGSPVVAPPEPGHAPAPYAGVAPEPGFPTHAAPPEATIGHTYEAPQSSPPPMPAPGDDYRAHFDEQFAGTGASYDDVADAYAFGSEAATDPELRWADDDVLRRRFNARRGYPEDDRLAWLGARRAVRHALEKGRG